MFQSLQDKTESDLWLQLIMNRLWMHSIKKHRISIILIFTSMLTHSLNFIETHSGVS